MTIRLFYVPGAISWTPPAGVTTFDALLVGGGGGGAQQSNGGGAGGAGRVRYLTGQSCTPGTPITGSVGAGGAGSSAGSGTSGADGTSTVFGALTAEGGGGGGGGASGSAANNGRAGASGGGGSGSTSAGTASTGGPGVAGQGNNGGGGFGSSTTSQRAGGGGGGFTGVGATATSGVGGNGGTGYDATALVGTALGESGWFASGGGGGAASGTPGTGPIGGGGDAGQNALPMTGGGGGGGQGAGVGGNGGGGCVILFYSGPVLNRVQLSGSGSWTVPAGVTNLVAVGRVAGGGAGGSATTAAGSGGGGGAGGVLVNQNVAVTPGSTKAYSVGAGGGAAVGDAVGGNGSDTTFAGLTTAVGGGGGGGSGGATRNGVSGGSGGGGGGVTSLPVGVGATGTGGQGNAGGNGNQTSTAVGRTGGGGGGAGAAGETGTAGPAVSARGGAGVDLGDYFGFDVGVFGWFGGGGGGGRAGTATGAVAGAGGQGGGGTGRNGSATPNATAGTATTGGGGGGGEAQATVGAGGSGTILITYETPGPPNVPTSVVATPDYESIDLTWAAPSGGTTPDSYQVRIDGGSPVTATSPHTFTGLVPGTTHTVEVRAVTAGVGSSSYVGATVDTLTVPAPEDLAVADTGPTSLTLTWAAPAAGPTPTGYEVRVDGGTPTDVGNVLTYEVTGLASETSYLVEVRAYGAAWFSEWASVTGETESPPLPHTPGPHVWVFTDLAAAEAEEGVDFSCFVDEVSVVHGRSDTTSQPDASAATVDFTATEDDDPAVWALVDIGAVVRLVFILPDETVVDRFLGRVTDLSLAWDDAGTETPNTGIGQLVATGLLADLGRRVVGTADYPQELDGARVSAVFTDSGLPFEPIDVDPGTVEIVAREANPSEALGVAHEAAESAGGMVWQTRAGAIAYADSEHRRGAVVGLTLDACDMLVTPQWRRDLSGLVNEVTVGFGTADENYTAESASSLAKWGPYARTYDTELAEEADATAMGNLLLLRNSSPVWVLSAIPVDVPSLTAEGYGDLLGLDVGSLIELTGLPAIGTAPTSMAAWVEGWSERWAYGVHEVELVVSDYCRTAPPVEWDEVDTTTTWDSYGTGTWDEASCGGYQPLPDLGRWMDVPASIRWDQVPTTTTWDTWEVP